MCFSHTTTTTTTQLMLVRLRRQKSVLRHGCGEVTETHKRKITCCLLFRVTHPYKLPEVPTKDERGNNYFHILVVRKDIRNHCNVQDFSSKEFSEILKIVKIDLKSSAVSARKSGT